ncbi:MAG: delta 1-pyrroline-5-carboxylate synthetase [Candidatus Bathyarchaeota archaeon]|nr:delta 1-pyrroline-5-carboxylate synthetase [Candidatus Bathyarchaeota archaeon]
MVKVGGSLASYPVQLRKLCRKLSEVSVKHRLVIVPGGGEFADVARALDDRFLLSSQTAHRMAVLGMDQYGLLLCELIPNALAVNTIDEAKSADSRTMPVFLPSQLMFSEDQLENSWDVTSDSIALYLADKLQAKKVLLVTDVDGVYDKDPKKYSDARLIKQLSPSDLLAMNTRSSVDKFLPVLLGKVLIDCYVINGLFFDRVEAVLENQEAICTLIKR